MNRFTPLFIDIDEAPDGYIAVAKKDFRPILDLSSDSKRNENICNLCDWRIDCDKLVCSCMSYDREDGIGVVFKRKEGC